MRLFQGIIKTGVAGSEYTAFFPFRTDSVKLEFYQLVYVLDDQHIRIEKNDALILNKTKHGQFRPAVVEP